MLPIVAPRPQQLGGAGVPQRVWVVQLVGEFGRGAEAVIRSARTPWAQRLPRRAWPVTSATTTVEATTIAATTTDTPVAAGSGAAGSRLPRYTRPAGTVASSHSSRNDSIVMSNVKCAVAAPENGREQISA